MSRTDEIKCIERVKESLRGRNNIGIVASNCNLKSIVDIFDTLVSNPKESVFPDFFYPNGYLEHFSVTSSKDNRKGSSFMSSSRQKEKETELYFKEQADSFFRESHEFGSTKVSMVENVYKDFSYSNFKESLKRHFEDHINSLLKSGFGGEVAFLIEQQDARMSIYVKNKFSAFYLLSKDKELLEFFSQYSNKIRYIIFVVVDSIELIDLSNINELIRSAPLSLDIRGGKLTTVSLKAFGDFRK